MSLLATAATSPAPTLNWLRRGLKRALGDARGPGPAAGLLATSSADASGRMGSMYPGPSSSDGDGREGEVAAAEGERESVDAAASSRWLEGERAYCGDGATPPMSRSRMLKLRAGSCATAAPAAPAGALLRTAGGREPLASAAWCGCDAWIASLGSNGGGCTPSVVRTVLDCAAAAASCIAGAAGRASSVSVTAATAATAAAGASAPEAADSCPAGTGMPGAQCSAGA